MTVLIQAYNFDQLSEITNLLVIFKNNKRAYFKDLLSLDDCRERFSCWESAYAEYSIAISKAGYGIFNNKIDYDKLFEILATNIKSVQILSRTDDIFVEQQNYISKMHNSNKQWYIIAYYCGQPYAGVFLFQGLEKPAIFIMQAICRFHVPYLYSLLNPSPREEPKVNDILLPFIENFVKKMNGEILYVAPLEAQGKILLRKYNFDKMPLEIGLQDMKKSYPEWCADDIRKLIDIETYFGGQWLYKIL